MKTGSVAQLVLAITLLAISSVCAQAQCLQWQDIPALSPGGGNIRALRTFNDGSGSALYAGGGFTGIGGVGNANRIAKWNGTAWSALGAGLNGDAEAMVALEGLNPALYVGGSFTVAGSVNASRIAKWDGSTWSSLGSGLSGPNVHVYSLVLFDDGSGTALYVGGAFTGAGGVPATGIAKWNGSTWSAVGTGTLGGGVGGMCVFDDGTGPALYATGGIMTPQGPQGIARWQGSAWAAVGSPNPLFAPGYALGVFNDGSGAALYVNDLNNGDLAKWNGATWSSLPYAFYLEPYDLQVFDDGVSAALYANGVSGVSKWDGFQWSRPSLSGGNALAVFQDGTDSAPDLYAVRISGQGGSVLSKWLGCAGADTPTGAPYCFGDGTGAACPCDPGQAGSAGSGCRNHLGTGGMLRAFGNTNVSVDTLSLVATGVPPTSIGLIFQGSQQQAGGLGIAFGDGLLCVNQNVVRLGLRNASGGVLTFGYGVPGDPSIAAQGQVPASGATRYYQHWYRDPAPYCTASTFNLTNAVRIVWGP